MSNPLSPSQQDGLSQVLGLMDAHKLTPGDVRGALSARKKNQKKAGTPAISKSEMTLRLFTYLGGTLIFAGLAVFINTIWSDIGSLPRVIITLGSGFTAYLGGVAFSKDTRWNKIATPAYIAAFLLQPFGLFVLLQEYTDGNDVALGSMIVFGPLALQQVLTFLKFRVPSLLLFSLLYLIGFVGASTAYFEIDRGLSSLMFGLFLFFITTDMQRHENFKDLTSVFYVLSTLFFFSGLYYFIGNTVFDPIALSLILCLLFFSVIRDSKTLYVLSMFYIAGYFFGGPGGGWRSWDYHNELACIFTGLSVALTGHWLKRPNLISFYPFWMFMGTMYVLGGTFSMLMETLLEPLYVALPVLGIYAALALHSRAVLAASVISLLGFISYFTSRYFADTIGWPISLIILGFVFIGLGVYAHKLSQKIRDAARQS